MSRQPDGIVMDMSQVGRAPPDAVAGGAPLNLPFLSIVLNWGETRARFERSDTALFLDRNDSRDPEELRSSGLTGL